MSQVELEKDAARYRFLREHFSNLKVSTARADGTSFIEELNTFPTEYPVEPQSVDRALDELMVSLAELAGDDKEEHF